MVFESAKIEFESKTSTELKKTPANWEQFKSRTVSYFDRKQNQVSDYICGMSSTYANGLKDQYLLEMGDAIDLVIQDSEVDVSELEQYNRTKRNKTNALKWRLERRWIARRLSSVKKLFKSNGLRLNLWRNVRTYLSVPRRQRTSISTIRKSMKDLFAYANTPLLKREMKNNENSQMLHSIFELYCRGNVVAARRETKTFKKRLYEVARGEKIRSETGLKQFGNKDITIILNTLVKTGVDEKKVVDYFIKNVKKLRSLNAGDFNNVVKHTKSSELIQFLVASILALGEGKTKRSIDDVRQTLMIESSLAKEKAKSLALRKKYRRILKDNINGLEKYREEHPRVVIDATTIAYEKAATESAYNITLSERDLILIQAKRRLSNLYLAKKERKVVTLKTLLKADSYESFRKASVKCGYSYPPFIAMIQASELKAETFALELDVKKWYSLNEKILGVPVQDLHNLFYRTGDMPDRIIAAFEARYLPQTESLIRIVDLNDEGELKAKGNFESISRGYASIKDIPPKENSEATMECSGYLSLLRNLHSSCIKVISNLESLLVLRRKSKAVTKTKYTNEFITTELRRFQNMAKYYARKSNDVANFLGVDPQLDPENIDKLTVSPLYGPLMRKRLAPHIEKINTEGSKMLEASKHLSFVFKSSKIFNDAFPKLISHKKVLSYIVNLSKAMKAARLKALAVKQDLLTLKSNPDLPPNTPKLVVRMYQKMINEALLRIEQALTDKDSPFSEFSIGRMDKQVRKFKAFRSKWASLDSSGEKAHGTALASAAMGRAVQKDLEKFELGEKIFTGAVFNSNEGLANLRISQDGSEFHFA
jgi:hypothetical protein